MFIFTSLLGLAYLRFWKNQNKGPEGCDFFIISGFGGENRKPNYVSTNRNHVLLIFSFSFVLNIPTAKKALIAVRVTVKHKAGQLLVLMNITD